MKMDAGRRIESAIEAELNRIDLPRMADAVLTAIEDDIWDRLQQAWLEGYEHGINNPMGGHAPNPYA